MPDFNPSQLPNLEGHIALVTGGTSGLGLSTCTELAKHGARVYLTGHSRSRGTKAIDSIYKEVPKADVIYLDLELSDLHSVEACAKSFLEKENRLHILVNNGGVMAPPAGISKQGYEIQFAVNYLSHYLLTKRLMPTLQATAAASPSGEVRIVNVSSMGHQLLAIEGGINFDDLTLKSSGGSIWNCYGQSKLANILHTKEIARRYGQGDHPILCVALHPGTVKTGLARAPRQSTWWYRFAQPLIEFRAPTARVGAYTQLYLAASPELKLTDNGCYLLPVGKKTDPHKNAKDPKLANKLWVWTEEQLAIHGL